MADVSEGSTTEGTEKKLRTEEPIVALYSYWRSSSSYRVRIALNIKHVAYDYRAVHLVKDGGHQLKDDYAILNPMCEVPTLLIHGRTLTQSAAIVEYLDDTYPDPPLMPRGDEYARFLVRVLAYKFCITVAFQSFRHWFHYLHHT
jgi:maleylpyruvate isomerase